MANTYGRVAGAFSIAAALVLTGTACSDDNDDGGKDTSVPTAIASALNSAGEAAKDALASASAAAASKLDDIKDGLDAKGDVSVGPTKTDGDRTTAEVTADNRTTSTADYTLTVDFRDPGGNLLDTIVMNIDNVEAGTQAKGTAKSNRTLKGETVAEVGRAVRH
ncbi:hypothetical protein [Embleya sp. NBC_00896]|uniref:hypothetical protein n=1 Tax=Embleya sp. NBC_00896 TaxID=2975961 RepID=UPI00386B42C2|nr:hypothetical protein OG928_26590 [Embleya sp. NBC_00896]